MKLLTSIVQASVAFTFFSASAEQDVVKHLTTIEMPEPIKRVAPKYPVNAAREGRTGWAAFSFVVEKDGSVSNIIEVDSSGSRDFSREARKAIAKWRYQPAMENGEPIQQCQNTVRLDFRMADGKSIVRKKFKNKYRIANEAIASGDLATAKEQIDALDNFKYLHAAESNFIHTIKALYYEKLGDYANQHHHLSSISFFHVSDLDVKYKQAVLHNTFVLAIKLNKFQSAYQTYEKLIAYELDETTRASYDKTIAQLNAFIASDTPYAVQGDIGHGDFWSYSLLRNQFSFSNISGNISKLDIRCANKRHVYSVNEQSSWTIPQAWNNCQLFVYGEDNTRFTLIEHPLDS